MQDKNDSDDVIIEEKISNILANDNQFMAWNKGLGIKLLIIFPIIVFIIGLFILNRPQNLYEIFFTLLYPFFLIAAGLILFILMRRDW